MKDQITLNLSYPVKLFGVTFFVKKRISFLFTNLAIFLFREDAKIEDTEQYKAWIEANGQTKLISEIIYFAAVAYSMTNRKLPNFDKRGLNIAVGTATTEDQTALINTWKNSNSFGLKDGETLKKKPLRLRKT